MIEIFMPKAGMDMQEGRVIRWLKEIGDTVEKDEPIMEIETDKISMEAESPASGILLAKLVGEDTVVPVLQTIGYIGKAGEEIPTPAAAAQQQTMTNASPLPIAADSPSRSISALPQDIAATPYAKTLAKERNINLAEVTPSGLRGEILSRDIIATPLARRIAEDSGVELAGIKGSGHEGKIRKEDVEAASASAPMSEEESRFPIAGMRKVIAQRMTKSHTEIPTVTQHMKVYVDQLLEIRERINESCERRISINDMMLKIVAKAVREHPVARTVIDGNDYVVRKHVNIGFAVGIDAGLLVPVIKDADTLTLSVLSAQAKELADRARGGKLLPGDMQGGCFTISNMGMFDVFAFTPIINQPEPGILGVCAVQDELALVDNEVVSRKYMMISLTYDHRIMNGTEAAAFQLRIKQLMEHPLEAIL